MLFSATSFPQMCGWLSPSHLQVQVMPPLSSIPWLVYVSTQQLSITRLSVPFFLSFCPLSSPLECELHEGRNLTHLPWSPHAYGTLMQHRPSEFVVE